MFLRINGLEIKQLEKAKDGIIPVKIIANHLTDDEDDETILKNAFNDETVKQFLDIGIIEWWHKTRDKSLSDEERAGAVLGKPTGFIWENGKPTVLADLTENHPIVQQMLPHLKANQPVYAASVGGSKVVMKVDTPNGPKKIIPKISWDHLAIAPCNSVVNREPGLNISIMKKANDLMMEFDNVDVFKSQSTECFAYETELRKTLLAPESTSDLYSTSGGVISKQSLDRKSGIISKQDLLEECNNLQKSDDLSVSEDEALDLIDTVIKIFQKNIPYGESEFKQYFKENNKEDQGVKFYSLFNKYNKNLGVKQ